MLVIGMLMVYILGYFESAKLLALPCVAVPIFLAMILFFIPDSPVLHVQKGNERRAKKSLKFFRGHDYNINSEMKEIAAFTKVGNEKVKILLRVTNCKFERAVPVLNLIFLKLFDVLKKRATIRAFIMLMGMHIIQQISGIHVAMYYDHKVIAIASQYKISTTSSLIILGVMQVIGTAVSVYFVDKIGRKILFIVSLAIMCVCYVAIGVHLMIRQKDAVLADRIAILHATFLCVYTVSILSTIQRVNSLDVVTSRNYCTTKLYITRVKIFLKTSADILISQCLFSRQKSFSIFLFKFND